LTQKQGFIMGLQISAVKDSPSDIKRILPVLSFKLCFNFPGPVIYARYARIQMGIYIDFNKRIYIFSNQAKE